MGSNSSEILDSEDSEGSDKIVLALLPAVIKSACEREGASEALTQNQAAKLWPNRTREASSAHSAAAAVVLHSLGKRKNKNKRWSFNWACKKILLLQSLLKNLAVCCELTT